MYIKNAKNGHVVVVVTEIMPFIQKSLRTRTFPNISQSSIFQVGWGFCGHLFLVEVNHWRL